MTTLTADIILRKTRALRLSDVRQLDCWYDGFSDVEVLRQLVNVEIISMGFNRIRSLHPFASCTHLKELYLRKNVVTRLSEVTALSGLRRLHTLWLKDNPCATHPHYRDFVLHCCQGLRHLDETEVTVSERTEAGCRMTPQIIGQILESGNIESNVAGNGNAPCSNSLQAVPSVHISQADMDNIATKASTPNISRDTDKVSIAIEELTDRCDNANSLSVGPAVFTTIQTQRTILTAIVTLMSELTLDSLTLIRQEAEVRINQKISSLAITDVEYNAESNNIVLQQ